MAKKIRLRFLETREVQDVERRIFKKGRTYTFEDEASANHWITRGVVEVMTGKATAAKTDDPGEGGGNPDGGEGGGNPDGGEGGGNPDGGEGGEGDLGV